MTYYAALDVLLCLVCCDMLCHTTCAMTCCARCGMTGYVPSDCLVGEACLIAMRDMTDWCVRHDTKKSGLIYQSLIVVT